MASCIMDRTGATTHNSADPLALDPTVAKRAHNLRRKRAQQAIQLLEQNGIDWQDETAADLLKANEPRPVKEFRSNPNAKPMKAEDVANVAPLSRDDLDTLFGLLNRLVDVLKVDQQPGDSDYWEPNDVRWTLTPHAAQKYGLLPCGRQRARLAKRKPK
jgi:hypothetical protein